MEPDKNKATEQSRTTDPQEDEKDGNILGAAFDKLMGDSEGGNSISEDEGNEAGKQGSIKHDDEK